MRGWLSESSALKWVNFSGVQHPWSNETKVLTE